LQAPTPFIGLAPRWAWLEFAPDDPRATVAAIRERLAAELGGRVDAYHPNDPEEGTEYASIFIGKAFLGLARKEGISTRISADSRDVPVLLRIGALYGAERRGWRWVLYRLWPRMFLQPQAAQPTPRRALYPGAS
jgi:hypothetical protein